MSPRTMVLRWIVGLMLTAHLAVAVPLIFDGIIPLLMMSSRLMWSIGSSLPRQSCLSSTHRSLEIGSKRFVFILSTISKDHDSDDQNYNDYNKGSYLTNPNSVCHGDDHNVSSMIVYYLKLDHTLNMFYRFISAIVTSTNTVPGPVITR